MNKLSVQTMISRKNPGLEKKLPGFIYRYLHRILHIDEVNALLEDHRDFKGVAFATAMVKHFQLNLEVTGSENLNVEPRAIYAANHPLGGLDGIALLSLIGEAHGSVRNLTNDFTMSIENLRELLVPVNKVGMSPREYFAMTEEMYASKHPHLLFPAGLCSRKLPYGIFDLQWNKSFVKKARQHNRPVVPVCVSGKNSNFFYNLARIRKTLRISFNLEMIYLIDEMFKQKNQTLKVMIAPPVSPETFDKRFDDWQWAAKLRQHVYTMLVTGEISEFDPLTEVTIPNTTL